IEAMQPVDAAKAAWLVLAEKERLIVEETQPTLDALRKYLSVVDGGDTEKLADYGIVARKRRALTAEQLVVKTRKARSTRRARQQAMKQTGEAAPALPPETKGGQ